MSLEYRGMTIIIDTVFKWINPCVASEMVN